MRCVPCSRHHTPRPHASTAKHNHKHTATLFFFSLTDALVGGVGRDGRLLHALAKGDHHGAKVAQPAAAATTATIDRS